MKKVAGGMERVRGFKKDGKMREKLDAVERRVDCRDCSRLPEKKTRIRGETFEDKKKGGGRGRNRGNREVETAGRTGKYASAGKEGKRRNSLIKVWSARNST